MRTPMYRLLSEMVNTAPTWKNEQDVFNLMMSYLDMEAEEIIKAYEQGKKDAMLHVVDDVEPSGEKYFKEKYIL